MAEDSFVLKRWLKSIFSGWGDSVILPPDEEEVTTYKVKLSLNHMKHLNIIPEPTYPTRYPEPNTGTIGQAICVDQEGEEDDGDGVELLQFNSWVEDGGNLNEVGLSKDYTDLLSVTGEEVLDKVLKEAQLVRFKPKSLAVRNALHQRRCMESIAANFEDDKCTDDIGPPNYPPIHSAIPELSDLIRVSNENEFESMISACRLELKIYLSCTISKNNLAGSVTSFILYLPSKMIGYFVSTAAFATTLIRKSVVMLFPNSVVYTWAKDELQILRRMFQISFRNVFIVQVAARHFPTSKAGYHSINCQNAGKLLEFKEETCMRNIGDYSPAIINEDDVLFLGTYRICCSLVETLNTLQYSVINQQIPVAVFDTTLRESRVINEASFTPVQCSDALVDFEEAVQAVGIFANRRSLSQFKRGHAHRLSRALHADVEPEALLSNADLLIICTTAFPHKVKSFQPSTGKQFLNKATWKAANSSSYRFNKCNECATIGCVALICPRRNDFENIKLSSLSQTDIANICRRQYTESDRSRYPHLQYQEWSCRYAAQYLTQHFIGDCSGILHYPLRFAFYGPFSWDVKEFNKFKRTLITPVYQTTFYPHHFRVAKISIDNCLPDYPNFPLRYVQYIESCCSRHGELAFRFSNGRRTIRILTGVVTIEEVPDWKMIDIKKFKDNLHNCKHPF